MDEEGKAAWRDESYLPVATDKLQEPGVESVLQQLSASSTVDVLESAIPTDRSCSLAANSWSVSSNRCLKVTVSYMSTARSIEAILRHTYVDAIASAVPTARFRALRLVPIT